MTWFRHTPATGRISPSEARDRSRKGEAILLDVREDTEFAAGHAPDAVLLPLSRLAAGAPLPEAARGLPVMAICRSGNRSGRAARLLAEQGVDAVNVTGGMLAWVRAGLPVSTSPGRAGQAG